MLIINYIQSDFIGTSKFAHLTFFFFYKKGKLQTEATRTTQIRAIKLESRVHRSGKASVPIINRRRVMTKICKGVSGEVGFSEHMKKLNNLELGSKLLNVSDNHLKAPRDGTIVKNTVDNEFRVTLHLNFEEVLTQRQTKTFPKSKSFCNGDMMGVNTFRTSKDWTTLIISYDKTNGSALILDNEPIKNKDN